MDIKSRAYLDLDLSDTGIFGPLPDNISSAMPSLVSLKLAENHINGSIPRSLCELKSLEVLDLKRNKLTGTIPDCLLNSQIHVVELSSNELSGNIPKCLPKDGTLELLSLNNNSLEGELPFSLSNCEKLRLLDVGKNKFMGVIPAEIISLSCLRGLNLSHNHFMGAIPKEIGSMKSLEYLDLSFNNLSGKIPKSISSIDFLSKLNFSFNNLHGQIPTGSQLQAPPDPSIYMGNPGLCGYPLPRKCFGDNSAQNTSSTVVEDEDEIKKIRFYLVIMLGFATGFWEVIGILVFIRSARHAFFQLAADLADWLYVRVVVRIARIRGRK